MLANGRREGLSLEQRNDSVTTYNGQVSSGMKVEWL